MLRSNQISCIDNTTFTGLSSVRLLSLYDNRISSIAPGAFSTLHSLSTMWVLSVDLSPSFYCFLKKFPSHYSHYLSTCVTISIFKSDRVPPSFVSASFFILLSLSLFPNFSILALLWELSSMQHTRTHTRICAHVALWTLFSSQMLSIIID